MKSREEILRIYQERFGHSHEAGVFAVFAAGVDEGKELQRSASASDPVAPSPVPPPAPPSTGRVDVGVQSTATTLAPPAVAKGALPR